MILPSCVFFFETLAQAGFEVDSALDGAMALEKLANQHYDAITVDIGLPDMSGFDVIHALRQQRASKHTPRHGGDGGAWSEAVSLWKVT